MRVVFMGTPEYAIAPLGALLASDFVEVVGVYTQPDRAAGRGAAALKPPVGRYCMEHGLPLFQPASLRNQAVWDTIATLAPDVVVVAAYGKFLPTEVLRIPAHGCLNIHPSLLPRHRGPSPVVTAILEGDPTTGVTLMVVDEGMDSGPVLAQTRTEIGPNETAGRLTARLFHEGGRLLCSVLPQWVSGGMPVVEQDEALATVTRKIAKSDGEAVWTLPCQQLARMVRAFDPWPGLHTAWKGKSLRVVRATPEPRADGSGGQPGLVVSSNRGGAAISTVDGQLDLHEIQLEGRQPMPIEEFVRGRRDFIGSVLPS